MNKHLKNLEQQMTTIPIIEIHLDSEFNKKNIHTVLKRAHGCSFYHLSQEKLMPKNKINLETATEYLAKPSNIQPDNLAIFIQYNNNYPKLSLFDNGKGGLVLRLSSLGNKTDISPYILFLMDITQDLPIFSMNTITDGSECAWYYGQGAASAKSVC